MSLDELKKLAREAEYGKSDLRVHPTTILELCALLEQAAEELHIIHGVFPSKALAAIKQWKELP